MGLLVCADCGGNVSTSAMSCVHCGNILQVERPGFVGMVIRALYALFTILLVALTGLIIKNGDTLGGTAAMVPLIAFSAWFIVSVSIAMLLYVTRHGRIIWLDQAARHEAPTTLKEPLGWAAQR